MTVKHKERGVSADFKDEVRDILSDAWNKGRLDGLDEIYSSDVVFHRQSLPDICGLDKLKAYINEFRSIYPDFKSSFDEMVMTENAACFNLTFHRKSKSDSKTALFSRKDKNTVIKGYLVLYMRNRKFLDEWRYFR